MRGFTSASPHAPPDVPPIRAPSRFTTPAKPLESLTPLLIDPRFQGKQAWQLEAVAKVRGGSIPTCGKTNCFPAFGPYTRA
jgi:hypothetical protein